ncbi:inositol monophosphatase family protein [Furfurilactobacillus siliginis]|uniref:Fructose 1,6-bisphosphatase n=1 Tax=Furfurilactobacillus siliginis TaxID=348151 RepID=A0A0R2L8N1_9LACO|nr:inositol monophosphatase family protein [Furfurilactobacillus siliginis]KRN94868.1 inositol-phosphate phosphatase [Furfurilactobacillus siliginis]GEK28439.1 fructose 1,6-bisphosphatase [Furfurilactobacillus siliginis]
MEQVEFDHWDALVSQWIDEAKTNICRHFHEPLEVEQKSGRRDLVTQVDKQNEQRFVAHIREADPTARILGEEGLGDDVHDTDGRLWIIDPLDGTMNFVKQHADFAIMLSLYIDGVGEAAWLCDVIGNKLFHGGRTLGVKINDQPLQAPADLPLEDGLAGLSGPLVSHDVDHMQAIAQASLGMRVLGSAGIAFTKVLLGQQVCYISYLRPWDFATGRVLAEELGLVVSTIDGKAPAVLSYGVVSVATKQAQQAIVAMQTM